MMIRDKKQVLKIIVGIIIATCSLLCMEYTSSKAGPLFAITFSGGLIVALESIKQLLFSIVNKSHTEHKKDSKRE